MHTAIKREICALARSNPSEEVCGFIYAPLEGPARLWQCVNIAEKKEEEFEIDPYEYLKVQAAGQVLGLYHSHPTPAGFSEADLECAEEMAIPFYLFDIQKDEWHEYLPASYQPPVEGARWILGFSDCYEVVRRYYRSALKVYIGDYDRDESFCHEEQNVIMQNFEKEGFEIVPTSSLRVHDVILFKTDKVLPQHFGIFLGGDQQFLHHAQNGFSRQEMLTGRWLSRILHVLRRKGA